MAVSVGLTFVPGPGRGRLGRRLAVDAGQIGIQAYFDYQNAQAALRQLVGAFVVDVGAQSSSGVSDDPFFVLQDGSLLEVSSDTGLDPWVVRLPMATFVGRSRL